MQEAAGFHDRGAANLLFERITQALYSIERDNPGTLERYCRARRVAFNSVSTGPYIALQCADAAMESDAPEGGDGAGSDDDDDDGGDDDSDHHRRRPVNANSRSSAPVLLKFEAVSNRVSFGRSQIYKLIKDGEFPLPIKIGKSSRWIAAEIDAWIVARMAARTNQEIGA